MPKSKKEFITLLANRMNTNEETAKQWIDAYTDTLIDIFKMGEGVSIDGLGGFYLERKRDSTAFKFNPSQKIRYYLGWSSTYKEK
ncbi:MAG: HU family DNA-binding protein [Bacteroidetes bacterium]|nr:HU family DNA-binding protein [Bacteroidota bacterium]